MKLADRINTAALAAEIAAFDAIDWPTVSPSLADIVRHKVIGETPLRRGRAEVVRTSIDGALLST